MRLQDIRPILKRRVRKGSGKIGEIVATNMVTRHPVDGAQTHLNLNGLLVYLLVTLDEHIQLVSDTHHPSHTHQNDPPEEL